MNAMTEAREYAITTRNPVIVQANCVRIGSHSNSDKQPCTGMKTNWNM